MKNIGIVGNGYVGRATSLIGSSIPLTENTTRVFVYDIDEEKCSHKDLCIASLCENCDFIFICVPTPMNLDGSCETMEVEKVVTELKDIGFNPERVVIRSTVPVGTSRKLGTMFMPEFLTEKKWEEDFTNQTDWILGTNDRNDSLRNELYSLFEQAYKDNLISCSPTMHFLSTEEAELVKYVRNCFLATKVSFFNEVYDFCGVSSIDYDRVRDAVILDDRVGKSHTQVPGPDGKRGFGGTCFPKDTRSFLNQLMTSGVVPAMSHLQTTSPLAASIKRNDQIDRTEQDWKLNKGRAVL
jgi:UDPglucose 6-dehydrogenase